MRLLCFLKRKDLHGNPDMLHMWPTYLNESSSQRMCSRIVCSSYLYNVLSLFPAGKIDFDELILMIERYRVGTEVTMN